MLVGADVDALAGAVAGWLARQWELDLSNRMDLALLENERAILAGVLERWSNPPVDRARLVTELRGMYARLGRYRSVRGMVDADATLDSWISTLSDALRKLVQARLFGAP